MEEFRNTYLQLCKAHNVDAQDCVLDAMTRSSAVNQNSGIILDLSTNGLTAATCQILGKVLSSSRNIQGLHLNDCMLPEPGVVAIARGLMSTASLTTLSLKGNNIRGAGAVSLAGLLRTNKHLKTLLLEWNVLGILDNSFATFAESLGVNATLERLDLRSNQLSHDCAAELASALRRNTSLLTLDLRWNNVGITGGRALLVAMETNKTLTRMDVAGNGIPADVVAALQTLVAANADRRALSARASHDLEALEKACAEKVARLERCREGLEEQLSDMRSQFHQEKVSHDEQTQEVRMRVRAEESEKQHHLLERIRHLEQARVELETHAAQQMGVVDQLQTKNSAISLEKEVALDERRSIVGSLTTQLHATETSLVAAETTAGDLSAKLRKREEEAVAAATQHRVEVAAAREEREKLEGELLARVAATTERCERAERKLEETGRRYELERGQACALKEELASAQAERKLKACEMQERLQQERSRGKQTLQEQEELRQREVAREGEELAGKDKEWQTEVGRVKLTVKEQKAMLEDQAGQLRQLEQQKSTLEKKLADQERKHREDVEEKDNAVNRLQEKLRRAEAEMGGMREEEAQRATMLQNAVLSYVTAVKSHQAK
ncbi:PREDICTED: leucine-rich repeat-containing protein 45-like [Priapulus caudatus]|uniref:Leucine-rich repeat-containing protein 45-like n=1 Tax=Priapulus caudatus TaxID=37621 RepID=A0ABM1F431_PRICU|nr:PREDICTED: leucine-rich repeat-containing protein 45-like [Priapulus caudatus]